MSIDLTSALGLLALVGFVGLVFAMHRGTPADQPEPLFIDDTGPAQPVTPESLLEHLKAVRDCRTNEIALTPLVAMHKATLDATIDTLGGLIRPADSR